jgi:hypothetical protein
MVDSQSVISKKFYVYELLDPRNGRPFYVGKGMGRRMYQHERDALCGHRSRKYSRIREIREAGLSVQYNVLSQHSDEEEAYGAEAARIVDLGLDSLTNVVPGGRGGYAALVERARSWTERGWRGWLNTALRFAFLSGCFRAPPDALVEFVDAYGVVSPVSMTVAEMRQFVEHFISAAIEVAGVNAVRQWVVAQQADWARGELRL